MNVYDAIMKAADQIDRDPRIYDFFNIRVPPCGSPGCLIGLTAVNLGEKANSFVHDLQLCQRIFGVSHGIFYNRLGQLRDPSKDKSWTHDAKVATACMRLYAAKYHAPAKPAQTFGDFKRDLLTKVHGPRIAEEA